MKPGKNSTIARLNFTRLAATVACVVTFLLPSVVHAQQSKTPKRVLVLYWYGRDFPHNAEFDRSFQNVLNSAAPGSIEYYPEYLETDRFPGEEQALLLRDYLRQKYADRTIDVVVASGYVPLDFLVKYRDELFPNTP